MHNQSRFFDLSNQTALVTGAAAGIATVWQVIRLAGRFSLSILFTDFSIRFNAPGSCANWPTFLR